MTETAIEKKTFIVAVPGCAIHQNDFTCGDESFFKKSSSFQIQVSSNTTLKYYSVFHPVNVV